MPSEIHRKADYHSVELLLLVSMLSFYAVLCAGSVQELGVKNMENMKEQMARGSYEQPMPLLSYFYPSWLAMGALPSSMHQKKPTSMTFNCSSPPPFS